MLNANDGVIRIIQNENEKTMEKIKAYVAIMQDQTRISGFLLCDGPFGLYLAPPKINGKVCYFDENKSRYKELQTAVIDRYNSTSLDINCLQKKVEPQNTGNEKENKGIDINDIPF